MTSLHRIYKLTSALLLMLFFGPRSILQSLSFVCICDMAYKDLKIH